MEQLSALDASFLYSEQPHAPSNAASIWIYDPSELPGGRVRFDDLLRHVQAHLHLVPPFRRKLARVPGGLYRPWWQDDGHFDLEYHVRHIALPSPGDWRQFCDQAARLQARPLDLTRPLWELYMIEGLDGIEDVPPGSFALMLTFHHAAIDGKASIAITDLLHTTSPGVKPPPEEPPWMPEAEASGWELLARSTLQAGVGPLRSIRNIRPLPPGLNRPLRTPPQDSFVMAPPTRFNGRISPHRVLDARFFDFEEVRRARTAVPGATVNDVALAVFGGALRQYLGSVGELPVTTMRAMTPVSVRDETAGSQMGNRLSAMVVSLATDVADPLERLAAVTSSTKAAKELSKAAGAQDASDLLDIVPAGLLGTGIRLANAFGRFGTASMVNTVVSNVAGPREPKYLLGARMVRSTGTGPVADGMGLINYVTTYTNQAMFGFTACRAMMPDPERYAKRIEQSFEELVDHA